MAERQTYEQQEETFSKIDRFYQKLWQKEKMFPSPFSNGLSLLKVPLREKLIAHAGGKVKGERYLNTLEAITASAERGYKYIELDLLKTADDRIVAAHDWFRLTELAGASPNQGLSKLDLSSISSLYTGGGIHTFLADMDILAFFAKHPGVYLVTDKIDDFGLLAKMFAPVKIVWWWKCFLRKNIVRRRRKDFLILHIIFKITKILNWFWKKVTGW